LSCEAKTPLCDYCRESIWPAPNEYCHYIERSGTAIVAFVVGGRYKPGNGFAITAAHSDSVGFKVKPSNLCTAFYNQLELSTYAESHYYLWFDRDLSVAGQVAVKSVRSRSLHNKVLLFKKSYIFKTTLEGDNVSRRLVRVQQPILYIPSLAFSDGVSSNSFEYDEHTSFRPIIEMVPTDSRRKGDSVDKAVNLLSKYHPSFMKVVAEAARVTVDQIVDMDLYVYDVHSAQIGGMHDEFITGGRTDNITGTYTVFKALVKSLENENRLKLDENIRIFSDTERGANSTFLNHVLKRLSLCETTDAYELALSRSMLACVDQAHAMHPVFKDHYEKNHKPAMNGGPTISVGESFSTTASSHSVMKQIAAQVNVPLQIIVDRNDWSAGSTYARTMSAGLPVLAVDVGCVELAAHSVRSMECTNGIGQNIRLYAREQRNPEEDFVEFLNRAVTPYHAVDECKQLLLQEGFQELHESEPWDIEPNGKFFVTRNRTAIIAFAIGGMYRPGNGFNILVANTDSPCLRVKPISKLTSEGYNQVGLMTWARGLWHTWFDRDLAMAGEVVIKTGDGFSRRLININKPILYVPSLAIHLMRGVNPFHYNKETDFRAIFETVEAAGSGSDPRKGRPAMGGNNSDPTNILSQHHPNFLKLVAEAAQTSPDQIVDMDLYVYDAEEARIGGINKEFITGARLDNLVGTYTTIKGLIDSLADDCDLTGETNIRMVACFDSDNVGGTTEMGAKSAFFEHVLRRLSSHPEHPTAFELAVGRSMMLMVDQMNATHPNYLAASPQIAAEADVPLQVDFRSRSLDSERSESNERLLIFLQTLSVGDKQDGGSLAPGVAAKLGMLAGDVGCAQLAKKSVREMMGTKSIGEAIRLYSVGVVGLFHGNVRRNGDLFQKFLVRMRDVLESIQ
uniref:Aspartyl aminopeptidase n=1 Tax=Heligmosomoides polygyrus TaxID=6339 RepID=A0A8L8K6F6_HELPZ